ATRRRYAAVQLPCSAVQLVASLRDAWLDRSAIQPLRFAPRIAVKAADYGAGCCLFSDNGFLPFAFLVNWFRILFLDSLVRSILGLMGGHIGLEFFVFVVVGCV
ncbi:hypothetical protein, partial [Streptomyces sp. CBMA370]